MVARTRGVERRQETGSPTKDSADPHREKEQEQDEENEDEDEDDESLWTFRVMFLGSISCVALSILNKYFLFQTTQCIMAMVSALVILYPLGHIMAKVLPKRKVYFPILRLEFSLNPGPFDVREYALISIFANTGAVYSGITSYSVMFELS
ncbi:Oligopeptide transporter 2 [Abeliophyllum distichum]|uniref:Oligopeptide transporter 2 n=1 Tax=Abeliophyllum distichum TaxID=126358 RepID=A0ABD1TIN7_9LAMI